MWTWLICAPPFSQGLLNILLQRERALVSCAGLDCPFAFLWNERMRTDTHTDMNVRAQPYPGLQHAVFPATRAVRSALLSPRSRCRWGSRATRCS